MPPRRAALLVVLLCLVGVLGTAWADGARLTIAPTRLVLDDGGTSDEINVINRGTASGTVRISLVNRRMTDEGRLVVADEPHADENFADGLIRFTPRRARLAPGESQIVRVLARTGGQSPGEYRSHLQFQVEPDPDAAAATGLGGGDFSIRLTPVYGVTIPLIVRVGELDASVSITDLDLVDGTGQRAEQVRFRLQRRGDRSVHGDVRVVFEPDTGPDVELGRVGGIAVYVPNDWRHVQVPLDWPADASGGGRLRVEYLSRENREEVLATEDRRLP